MTRLLSLFLLALTLAAAPARAQLAVLAPEDQTAIQAAINAQMAAFRADDAELAFAYASPAIRQIFRNPGRFMRMVERGFGPVYRSQRVRFLPPVLTTGGWVQPVFIVGPDGLPVIADFTMQAQQDGSWRIHGCHLRTGGDQEI